MERVQGVQVDIADAVRVGGHEIVAKVLDTLCDPGARVGVLPRVHHHDVPRRRQSGRKRLDQFALVSRREHEPRQAMIRVDLEYMRENGTAGDRQQRFRDVERVRVRAACPFRRTTQGW